MADSQISAAELRAKAHELRDTMRLDDNPTTRNARLKLVIEYERLAEIEERKLKANDAPLASLLDARPVAVS